MLVEVNNSEGSLTDTVNIETTCNLRKKMKTCDLGGLLAKEVPDFFASKAAVGLHRREETEFRINKVPVALVDKVIDVLALKNISARKVPQKTILFASSIPHDLDHDQILEILRQALRCPTLEITIWTRGMNEGDINNGCAKLYLPREAFSSCDSSFQETITAGEQFSVSVPGLHPIRVRKWFDKRKNGIREKNVRSNARGRSNGKNILSAPSFSSVVSKGLSSSKSNFNDEFKLLQNDISRNASTIVGLRDELKRNNEALSNFEEKCSQMVATVRDNRNNIQQIMSNQNVADVQLKNISTKLAQITTFIFNTNNSSCQNNSLASNVAQSSTLMSRQECTLREDLQNLTNGLVGAVHDTEVTMLDNLSSSHSRFVGVGKTSSSKSVGKRSSVPKVESLT